MDKEVKGNIRAKFYNVFRQECKSEQEVNALLDGIIVLITQSAYDACAAMLDDDD